MTEYADQRGHNVAWMTAGEREQLDRCEKALGLIVQWENTERPHKNIPLMDCADLAQRALHGKNLPE